MPYGLRLTALVSMRAPRPPRQSSLYKAGIPLAVLAGKDFRWLMKPREEDEWEIKNRLIRRHTPPQLKAYL